MSNPIADAVKKYGIRGPGANGEFSVCCPFCAVKVGKVDTSHKMQCHPLKQVYHCYRCGSSGKYDILKHVHGGLAAAQAVSMGRSWEAPFIASDCWRDILRRSLRILPSNPINKFQEYCLRRSVLGAVDLVGGLACTSGKYANRIIIPIRDRDSHLTGFSARDITGKSRVKYLYPTELKRKEALFGIDTAIGSRPVYLVEGVFDALAMPDNAVAALGKNVTTKQLDILVNNTTDDIYVCLDGDAWAECRDLALLISLHLLGTTRKVFWAHLPPGEDPGKLGPRVNNYMRSIGDNT